MRANVWPLPGSVGRVLERALAKDASHVALVAVDGRMTYEELDSAADQVAGALAELGVKRDDIVAVSLPNASDVVITFHAVARLGAIWLGLNRNLAPPEKRYILDDSGARLVLATAEVESELVAAGDPETVPPIVVVGGPTWQGLVASGPLTYHRPICHGQDPAGIAYTSGTTGRPKGVLHSHQNLLLPGAMLVRAHHWGPELKKGDCAALTILNMQVTSTLLVAQVGGTQVVMDRVDPVGVAHWVKNEQVSSWFGVPTILQGLTSSDQVTPGDLDSLTDVWTGGTHLPEPIRVAFEERFGCRVSATYGLTEAPTVVTIEDLDDARVAGSSGRALPHLSVEIRDGDKVLEVGEDGDITVRAADSGPYAQAYRTMLGYLGHPEATDQTVRGGVLYTGDIGHIDADGRLVVRDRRNALILRGGANVYPAEVERVLLDAPGVRGASVVGVSDQRLGQRVAAAVEPEEGSTLDADELTAHCRAQLARYKVPESWRFAVLPRNAMGKVARTEIEHWFADETSAT